MPDRLSIREFVLSSQSRRLFLGLWATAAVLAGTLLTSLHQPLASPADNVLLLAPAAAPGWRAVHVLDGTCGCSRKVLRYLAGRERLTGLSEQVVLFHGQEFLPEVEKLRQTGFQVVLWGSPQEASAAALPGVPALVFSAPGGRIAYSGGYGMEPYRDVAVWTDLQTGKAPKPDPIYGCAVSRSLQRAIDPWGWTYPER